MLLVFGGSQGAHNINLICSKAVPKVMEKIPELQVAHICGANDRELLEKAYGECGLKFWIFPFFEEMASLMAKSNSFISYFLAISVKALTANE